MSSDNGTVDPSDADGRRDAPDAWGIHDTWIDAHDRVQRVSEADLARLRDLIGKPPADLEATTPLVLRRGAPLPEGGRAVCEDGSVRELVGSIPDDFPFGYHRLEHEDGRERALIVSPGRCWLPDGWRAWGWTTQLYAARSSRSWGMGDLRDLRTIRDWAQGMGAEYVLINPLHAVAPTFPQEPSPYLPTSRRYRNPIYLCVDETAGAEQLDLSAYEDRRRALNNTALIDRDAIWMLKAAALRSVFEAWLDHASDGGDQGMDAFAAWRGEQGEPLHDFAVWMVLATMHGSDWRRWPEEFHDPRSRSVQDLAAACAGDVDFQAWLQWQLDEQLHHAGVGFTVIQDLPIGVDGGGADAWTWQGVLAAGVTVGAPPDLFSTHGQDWGSPPMIPWRARTADYQPFIESVRATMANAGGLRIDHVMGLFRLWWVPAGSVPAQGAYVRYPSHDLLDIVALESHRQQALVVGEDLGTVEAGVRETLADRGILSYRLLWFEDNEPPLWPRSSMAAITTHDLPTVAGLWSGADLVDQLRYSTEDPATLERQRDELMQRLRRAVGALDATPAEVVLDAHRYLGTAPSVLLSATLDDAVGALRRPNVPGATERENWCLPLPVLVDDLPAETLPADLANVLNQSLAAQALVRTDETNASG